METAGNTVSAIVPTAEDSLPFRARIAWLAAAPVVVRLLSTMIAVLLPLAVGLSRMYRGMHHLTDVLGGSLSAVSGCAW